MKRPARVVIGPLPEGSGFLTKVKAFFWGLLFYEMYHELEHDRHKTNDALNLMLFGEMIGLPLMNSCVTLKLLPYFLPTLERWKLRQLEEKEVIEEAPHVH